MHKSLNISLVKTSTVSFNNCFKLCSQSAGSQKNYQGSHFLYPFICSTSKHLLFFRVFSSSSFQSMFRRLISDIGGMSKRDIVKASCCQVILYILHFARFPILIFKINFAISAFGNFLRNVQLKWFHFNHPSHTTESVLMAIIFWQTRQNHFELFFLS